MNVGAPTLSTQSRGGLPADLCVSIADGVRVLAERRLLLGGTPLRAISLTPHGARVIAGWMKPGPIGAGSGRQVLARRLLDAGMLSPHPDANVSTHRLTFVVPVRDRPEQLERCLAALARAAPDAGVIVVDDGSVRSVRVPRGPDGHARVIRHPASRGPSAARNTGLSACTTEFVAFVDSDVVLPEAAAGGLLAHFVDPRIAAVAPRVLPMDDRGAVAGYEARHSALDMGAHGGLVAPGRPIPYIPSTALFVRRAAIHSGFDESLPIGEDVDFVWRLAAAGWQVRYAPEVHALHEHPMRLPQFIARRHVYACSVGLLARRHPDALPAVWMHPRAMLVWALALSGFRGPAAGVATQSIADTDMRLAALTPNSLGLAARITLDGIAHTGVGLCRAVRRAWLPPLLMLALHRPQVRTAVAAAFAAPIVQDVLSTGNLRAAVSDAPLRILDELIAAAGTWEGCFRARTLRPLLPAFTPARGRAV
jgi:mycofactocin system glycosyltransferase